MDDKSTLAFKAILGFITDLNGLYGNKYKYLARYALLLSKTAFTDTQHITRNVDLFSKFVVNNREAIVNKDHTRFSQPNITYSERIYVNMNNIFSLADPASQETIWKHLLIISIMLDPLGGAKEVLRKVSSEDAKNETNFLTNIISKVEQTIGDKTSSPGETIATIMNSGLFTEIISGMQNEFASGKLDIGKLVGTVQGMMSNMGTSNPENKELFDNLNSNISNLTTGNGDMSSMMSLMTGMMGSLASTSMSTSTLPLPPPSNTGGNIQ